LTAKLTGCAESLHSRDGIGRRDSVSFEITLEISRSEGDLRLDVDGSSALDAKYRKRKFAGVEVEFVRCVWPWRK